MKFNVPQLAAELDQLVFARVTGVRSDGKDLAVRPEGVAEDAVLVHFFGFAKRLDGGGSVWFKKMSHVASGGRPGLFLGPVSLRPRIGRWCDLPRRGDVVVGQVTATAKGPVYEWWCHRAEPLLALARVVRVGRVRATASLWRDLALRHDRTDGGSDSKDASDLSDAPDTSDDLWCLARLVVGGDLATLAGQLRAPARRPPHPVRREAHTRSRGVRITHEPLEFVWHAAALVRSPELLARFRQYLVAHKLWTPALRDRAEAQGWTDASLARVLGA